MNERSPKTETGSKVARSLVGEPIGTLTGLNAMNIDEIERSPELPWGLHDARLERLHIDWMTRRIVIEARVKIDERQETERRLRINVTGLVYCALDAPQIDPKLGYDATPAAGLEIDSGTGAKVEGLPATPDGAFLHWFFVQDWNRFIHICAQDATWEWLDQAPTPAMTPSTLHWPGEEIPDLP